MGILIAYPWAAAIFAAAFAALWRWRGRRNAALATALWALYAVYEYLMYVRVLCTGECNIRVDLLLIYPVLLTVSAVAVVSSLRARRADEHHND